MAEPDRAPLERELVAQLDFLRALARDMVFDDDRADELVQSTCLAALHARPRSGSGLRSWLATVLRRASWRLTRSELERDRREARRDPATSPGEPPDRAERRETLRALLAELDGLEDPYAAVVEMRYFEGLSVDEVARRLGAPPATVRTWCARGIDRLRRGLAARTPPGGRHWSSVLAPLLAAPLAWGPGAGIGAAAVGGTVTSLLRPFTGVLLMSKKIGIAAAGLALIAVGIVAFRALDDTSRGRLDDDARRAHGPADASLEARREATPTGETVELDPTEATPVETGEGPRREEATPIAARLAVSGRAVDAAGRPVAGASVQVAATSLSPRDEIMTRRELVTGADGRFVCDDLPLHRVLRVRVRSERHCDVERMVTAAEAERRDLGDLRLEEGGAIAGRVVDAEGRGIAGATVFAWPGGGVARLSGDDALRLGEGEHDHRIARTDARGEFRFLGLLDGEWRLRARAEGLRAARVGGFRIVERGRIEGVELKLLEGERIAGVIRDDLGRPVADARVKLSAAWIDFSSDTEGENTLAARSDAEGRFSFRGLPTRPWNLVASRPGHIEASLYDVDGGRLEIELTLPRTGEIFGRVTDARTDEPTGDLRVTAARGASRGQPVEVLTGAAAAEALGRGDESGWYLVRGLGSRRAALVVSATGYATRLAEDIALASGERTQVDLALVPESRITGRVFDVAGEPVAGATVEVTRPPEDEGPAGGPGIRIRDRVAVGTATSDADGAFEIAGLAAGGYLVGASRTPHVPAEPRAVTLEVGSTAACELRLAAGGRIEGFVTDAAGEPLVGATVRARPDRPASHGGDVEIEVGGVVENGMVAVTDETGAYGIDGLRPGGYRVALGTSGGATFRLERPDAAPRGEAVAVRAGEVARKDLTAPPVSRVVGIVLEAGRPVPGAKIRLLDAGNPFPLGAPETFCDEWGEFAFDLVEPGSWRLEAQAPRGPIATAVDVELGRGEIRRLEITLPSGAITGRVTRDGDPVAGVEVTVLRWAKGRAIQPPRAIMIGVTAGPGGESAELMQMGNQLDRVRTDADGRYRLPFLADGDYAVKISGQGLLNADRQPVAVKEGRETRGVDFAATKGASLTVSFRGLPEGRGLALVTLLAEGQTPEEGEGDLKSSSGAPVRFEGLGAGTYRVRVQLVAFSPEDGDPEPLIREVSVREGRDEDYEFVIPKAGD
ncbi:MAG: sigma-70 family RNA polymerase sigma factor [Planctomycetota bacterium]